MGIEVATFISELVVTNPVGAVDDYATADDHLRLIKAVLQGQFPNFTALAMDASVVELNLLVGLTADATELNKLDGFTGNAADLNVLDGADAGGLTAAELLFVADVTSAIQAQLNGKAAISHTHNASDIDAGSMDDARIPVGNVVQHVAAIDHNALLNFLAAEHVDWAVSGGEDIEAGRSINGALALTSGEIAQLANIGGTTISAADWTAVAALLGVNTGDEPDASTSVKGIVERANAAEADALSDTTRYVAPADFPITSESQRGLVERATQAEVDAGSDTTRYISPATLPSIGPVLRVVKTADESVSNTTLQDDNHLTIQLVSGKYYEIRLLLHIDTGAEANADLKLRFTTPGASTGSWHIVHTLAGTTTLGAFPLGATAQDWDVTMNVTIPANVDNVATIVGSILAASSGTFKLRWAQGIDNGTTTLRKHSYMIATEL